MINKEYKEINEFIKGVNCEVLGGVDDIYYISNNTLVRNPFASKILSKSRNISEVSIVLKVRVFFKYYFKAFILFFIYILKFFIYRILKGKTNNDYKILVDTYFIMEKIDKTGKFKDIYFQGLEKVLEKNEFSYLVKSFYGSPLNIKMFFNVIKIIKKSQTNIICEYDIINTLDLIKIFYFIFVYPFKINSLYNRFKGKNLVFDYSLFDSINGSNFQSYIRYIVGKKINIKNNVQKIISWCEYQSIDKSFYKGLNETGNQQCIYGCQFLVSYDSWLNFFIPKEEVKYGLTPNILLTNGKYYLNNIEIPKRLGVSLRYSHLFIEENQGMDSPDSVLVLGSFILEETLNLIEIVKKIEIKSNIILRLHPTHNFKMFEGKIPKNWILSDMEELSDVIFKSNLVITNGGTGTPLETVCKAKSTLLIGNNNGFTSLPLTSKGKGEIWDLAFTQSEVIFKYNSLLNYRDKNRKKIDELASWYKDNFFIKPTKKKILEIFDLEKE